VTGDSQRNHFKVKLQLLSMITWSPENSSKYPYKLKTDVLALSESSDGK